MILNKLNKILAKGTYIKLTVFALILQLVSLFRNYPTNHPCGRVLEITKGLAVLINCDSAVYMKDAQSPIRLFNGQSVYQDRPLPTLLVSLFAKIWHFFNLPDYHRDIVGNSGVVITYSLVTYILFLLLSATILGVSCWLGIKTFSNITDKFDLNNQSFALSAFVFTILISMNELTKTFFWTPGSQMFNLLIPVYLFYLLQFAYSPVSNRFFLLNVFAFLALIFSYAFFILLIIPLLLLGWKSYRLRLLVIALPVFIYALYPILIKLLGGTYYNFSFGYRRLYIWVIDAYFDNEFVHKISWFLTLFLKTFPIIPTILSLIILLFFINYKKNLNTIKPEFLVLTFYIFMLAFYGYYSRRLTLPIIIFLLLMILKMYMQYPKKISSPQVSLAFGAIISITMFSWLFTNGPLM
jgi:hypothetical protein